MHNKKCFAFLFTLISAFVLFAGSCYSTGNREQQSKIHGSGTDDNNSSSVQDLVFIGVSARLSSHNESIRNALNDAARKLSFFQSVSASSEKFQSIGASDWNVSFDSGYSLQYDDDLDKYLDLLEYDLDIDLFENNNAVFITAKVASNISMPVFRGHSISKIRPYWVDTPPSQIGGFAAGVGFSGRLYSYSDTVVRSYEKAVISIIENTDIFVSSEQWLYQTDDFLGFDAQSTGGTSAYGTLENFYVIESWTDEANMNVWTLAVAGRKF